MDFVKSSYSQFLQNNATNLSFHEAYKISHEKLCADLRFYTENIKPPILVPVCNRVLMKGNLIHTNEVMVSLGGDYFVKCSSLQAQTISQRRVIKADSMIRDLENERCYLESQLKFSEENIFPTECQEIIEPFDEETDKEWRRQRVSKTNESRRKEFLERSVMNHNDFMEKLDLLELQEDIDELYTDNKIFTQTNGKINDNNQTKLKHNIQNAAENTSESREFMLRKKLADLRQRKKTKCNTEDDVAKRLDELEIEEEIEDELDRLYENTSCEELHDDSSCSENSAIDIDITKNIHQKGDKSIRKVSFGGEISETENSQLIINFSHSDVPVSASKSLGALDSPSDIYDLFPQCFKMDTKPIIKNCHRVEEENHFCANYKNHNRHDISNVLGDIVQHVTSTGVMGRTEVRPISKFKEMRMAKKK